MFWAPKSYLTKLPDQKLGLFIMPTGCRNKHTRTPNSSKVNCVNHFHFMRSLSQTVSTNCGKKDSKAGKGIRYLCWPWSWSRREPALWSIKKYRTKDKDREGAGQSLGSQKVWPFRKVSSILSLGTYPKVANNNRDHNKSLRSCLGNPSPATTPFVSTTSG